MILQKLYWVPELLCLLSHPLAYCRYEELAESVEDYVLDVLRDQLNRRQPMDNVSRNLLRLLTATCGYKEARLMAVQRLEMWLQNPKVRGVTHILEHLQHRISRITLALFSVCIKIQHLGCELQNSWYNAQYHNITICYPP